MARISLVPTSREFKLKFGDDPFAVSIRQARTGDAVQLGNLFSETTRVWDDADFGPIQLKQKWNQMELQRMRAYLTMVACDLEDENGDPLFLFRTGKHGPETSMGRDAFNQVWDSLPQELTDMIHECVIKANPQWGPRSGE